METIGLLGGMSWESSAEYYRLINEDVRRRLGGHSCAEVVLVSLDFAEIEDMQRRGAWDEAGAHLARAADRAYRAGAGVILLCTNTMHKVAEAITSAVPVPFIHIVDATGERIADAGHTRVALLGSRFTMMDGFYQSRLRRFGVEVLVPDEPDRAIVDDVIYTELTRSIVDPRSRREYQRVISSLADAGAEAVILGCTEITLLIGPGDSSLPVFDTTRIHTEAVVDYALAPLAGTAMDGS
ncbi:MAG: amino acid racemase [Streptosporangiales bacterium]|nr:amino acid racemase [Streptosporangiales bacterium]